MDQVSIPFCGGRVDEEDEAVAAEAWKRLEPRITFVNIISTAKIILKYLCRYQNNNITSLTKNWFCYDAHFKHQQAKRWILKRFVGVSQEEQVLNL